MQWDYVKPNNKKNKCTGTSVGTLYLFLKPNSIATGLCPGIRTLESIQDSIRARSLRSILQKYRILTELLNYFGATSQIRFRTLFKEHRKPSEILFKQIQVI